LISFRVGLFFDLAFSSQAGLFLSGWLLPFGLGSLRRSGWFDFLSPCFIFPSAALNHRVSP
jgi:hypothetical protein